MRELTAILDRMAGRRDSAGVLATVVSVAGSSYRQAGARMLIDGEGSWIGSVSGGCLEEDVRLRAQRVATTGEADLASYDTTTENDLVWGVGLGCHGVVHVLLEKLPPSPKWAAVLRENLSQRVSTELAVVWQASMPAPLGTRLASELSESPGMMRSFRQRIDPPPALFVFGAGNDAQPLVRLAAELGWTVVVADARPDQASHDRFPAAHQVVVAPPEEIVTHASLPAGAIAVVMTHRYAHDVPILRELFANHAQRIRYIGLLGPKKRAERILNDLARDGVVPAPEALQRFHAPVGLDLGADTPEEVALSIIAEIRATLGQRDARPLRDRNAPIHA
jgi:xanthine/CO dehydrogenase XdhC/CoxF family maturation factor